MEDIRDQLLDTLSTRGARQALVTKLEDDIFWAAIAVMFVVFALGPFIAVLMSRIFP
jgi:hypothetical protein